MYNTRCYKVNDEIDIQRGPDCTGVVHIMCTTPAHPSDQLAGEATASRVVLLIGCLLNVPARYWFITGTDLLRQFDVLPH